MKESWTGTLEGNTEGGVIGFKNKYGNIVHFNTCLDSSNVEVLVNGKLALVLPSSGGVLAPMAEGLGSMRTADDLASKLPTPVGAAVAGLRNNLALLIGDDGVAVLAERLVNTR